MERGMFSTLKKDSKVCEDSQVLALSDEEEPLATGSQGPQEESADPETMVNTQAILEKPARMFQQAQQTEAAAAAKVSATIPVSSKKKGGALKKGQPQEVPQAKKVKTVRQSQLYGWLKQFWHTQLMVVVMNEFLKNARKWAMENQRSDIYKMTQALTKIMKAFIIWLQDNGKIQEPNSTSVSFETYEEWALKDGLSTTFSNLPVMDTVPDLDDTFFNLFSSTVMEFEEAQDEDLSLYQSTERTCTSSMTVPTPATRAGAESLSSSKAMSSAKRDQKSVTAARSYSPVKSVSSKRQQSLKRKLSESESDDEQQVHKATKKVTFQTQKPAVRRMSTDSEAEDSQGGEEDAKAFSCLLDDIAQAASLTRGTSRISSCITCQDSDECITLKSPGSVGKWVMKFEVYPYKYCVRNAKNQWWQEALMRSTIVVSGRDSPVGRLMEKMKRAIIEQVKDQKGTEVERKPRSSRGGFRNS